MIASQLLTFFKKAYCEELGDNSTAILGFYVAGYSDKQPFSEEYEFQLPKDSTARQVRPLDEFGSSWRGVAIPFTRLYMGVDPRLLEELGSYGISDTVLAELRKKYNSSVVYDGMPVQDAINFVAFILQTTVGMATFEVGTASCGGPLQIATILPEEGFRWIAEPVLSAPASAKGGQS